jgi:hypothetical protein
VLRGICEDPDPIRRISLLRPDLLFNRSEESRNVINKYITAKVYLRRTPKDWIKSDNIPNKITSPQLCKFDTITSGFIHKAIFGV